MTKSSSDNLVHNGNHLPPAKGKPCRSGQTGMRPFGTLGPKIEVEKYDDQFRDKVAIIHSQLLTAIPDNVLSAGELYASPPRGHRHRAGPLVVRPGDASKGTYLEFAMWDPAVKAHSIVFTSEVPIYSSPIATALDTLRFLPIELDVELQGQSEQLGPKQNTWGSIIGKGLRAVQLHSTLSGELLLGLAYHDERIQHLRRSERLPGEEEEAEKWKVAAAKLRELLTEALAKAGAGTRVDVVGRWKRRRLCQERDFVEEKLRLPNGRCLVYKQPEGQFSNPNAPCEVHCLDWLCRQAQNLRESCNDAVPRLLELHCGGGNNTVALACYFDEVVAVEINRVLAEACEDNLRANSISNVRLVRAPSAIAATSLQQSAEVVLVDPPRSGLDDDTRRLVASFEHVLYISCNPVALAADLRQLSDHTVCSYAFFDMFPYTTHAEVAVRLRRRTRNSKMNLSRHNWIRAGLVIASVVVAASFLNLRRAHSVGRS